MADFSQPADLGGLPACLRKLRFNPDEAPEYMREAHGLTIAKATLNKLRCVGGGPSFRKFGRAVMYDRTDLDAWANAKLSKPFSSTSAAS